MADVKKILNSNIENLQPTWVITAVCLVIVSLFAWLLAEWFYGIFGTTTPYVLTLVPGLIFAWLYGIKSKDQRTIIKSVFDTSWNIWTLIGAAFLFHAAASIKNPFDVENIGNDLSGALQGSNPALLSFVFAWVYPTAVGRVFIPLCDIVLKLREAKKPASEDAATSETLPA